MNLETIVTYALLALAGFLAFEHFILRRRQPDRIRSVQLTPGRHIDDAALDMFDTHLNQGRKLRLIRGLQAVGSERMESELKAILGPPPEPAQAAPAAPK